MTLPEHVLNRECDHGVIVDICEDEQCQAELSGRENDAARERLADAIADGEFDQGETT